MDKYLIHLGTGQKYQRDGFWTWRMSGGYWVETEEGAQF